MEDKEDIYYVNQFDSNFNKTIYYIAINVLTNIFKDNDDETAFQLSKIILETYNSSFTCFRPLSIHKYTSYYTIHFLATESVLF